MSLNRARLTPARRRKNIEGLWEVLGVPPDGTIAAPPGHPHRDDGGGLGFLRIGDELMEVDHDELTELIEDVRPMPRKDRSGRRARPAGRSYFGALMEAAGAEAQEEVLRVVLSLSPGERDSRWLAEHAALLFAPEVVEAVENVLGPFAPGSPGVGSTPPAGSREGRERRRRRGSAGDALLGRGDAGSSGDVDLPDAEVGESAAPRLSAALAGAVEAGLVTEEEAYEVSGHASGDRDGSGLREGSSPQGRVSERRRAVERLAASAERVCGCSDGGPDAAEDRKCGCGGICRMAERHGARYQRAAGLRESEEVGALRDWAGDLAA